MVPVWAWLLGLVVLAIIIYLVWLQTEGKPCADQDDCGEGSGLVCVKAGGATKGRCRHTGSPAVY